MTTRLGSVSIALMVSVRSLGDDAIGSALRHDMEARMGRPVTHGQLYLTLGRLVDGGLLAATIRPAEAVRGGRRRNVYHLTEDGARALDHMIGDRT